MGGNNQPRVPEQVTIVRAITGPDRSKRFGRGWCARMEGLAANRSSKPSSEGKSIAGPHPERERDSRSNQSRSGGGVAAAPGKRRPSRPGRPLGGEQSGLRDLHPEQGEVLRKLGDS